MSSSICALASALMATISRAMSPAASDPAVELGAVDDPGVADPSPGGGAWRLSWHMRHCSAAASQCGAVHLTH
eukprot:9390250-Alexandrium_andersonii.AAC.1